MKLSATRRALILANIFNSLVAFYFIIIAIVGLVQLRWYHQLTVSVRVRHVVTLTTSYFAFIILILIGLALLGLFITSALRLTSKNQQPAATPAAVAAAAAFVSPGEQSDRLPQDERAQQQQQQRQRQRQHRNDATSNHQQATNLHDDQIHTATAQSEAQHETTTTARQLTSPTGFVSRATNGRAIVVREASISEDSRASTCCSVLLHLLVTIGLIVVLLIWLFNTGELVRDAISTQLDYAFARYQFTNRSNRYSIAIDGMQDINNCCGSLDYSDFPHQRVSGLSAGHYPGSCCGKNIFGVNARVLCTAEEIYRAKQTSGCTTVVANYYDLISLLVVPVALVCLFVNITIIALITISRRGNVGLGHHLHHHQHALAHPGDNSNYHNRANLRRARRHQQHQQQLPPQHRPPNQSLNTSIGDSVEQHATTQGEHQFRREDVDSRGMSPTTMLT